MVCVSVLVCSRAEGSEVSDGTVTWSRVCVCVSSGVEMKALSAAWTSVWSWSSALGMSCSAPASTPGIWPAWSEWSDPNPTARPCDRPTLLRSRSPTMSSTSGPNRTAPVQSSKTATGMKRYIVTAALRSVFAGDIFNMSHNDIKITDGPKFRQLKIWFSGTKWWTKTMTN